MAQHTKVAIRANNLLLRARLAGLDTNHWDDAAHRYATACGCGLGAAFGVGSLGLLFALTTEGYIGSPAWIVTGTAVAFAMVGVGKGVGIGIAQIRLCLLIAEILRAMARNDAVAGKLLMTGSI